MWNEGERVKIAIVGLGLIGGSLGMALKRTDEDIEIIGVDINEGIIQIAKKNQAIDSGTCNLIEGVKDADIVFVATFISKTIDIVKAINPHLKKGAIISDVCSTKEKIACEIKSIIREDLIYVGGHPMSGSEKHGIEAADPYLFENAVYVLLEEEDESFEIKESRKLVERFISKIGARVLLLNAKEHDMMVASISHLPHLLAGTLVNTVGRVEKEHHDVFKLAAGGFRDVTRIADSSPEMWNDIFHSNKDALLNLIKIFREQLKKIEETIVEDKSNDLNNLLIEACRLRRQVPEKVKGLLPKLYEIVVTIPDKPGEIGKVANVLGAKDINIVDIEILRVREGDGGTLRLGFTKESDIEEAIKVLNFFGYVSRIL